MMNLRSKREPDFAQFLKAVRREGVPDHLPFYEHLASEGFIARRTGTRFDEMTQADEGYWKIYVDFWLGMGYDCVPMEIMPNNFNLPDHSHHGGDSRGSEARVVFRTMEDVERFPWPDAADPIDFRPFEIVASLLPRGARIVGGVCAGPYEWASTMLGVEGMAYAIADCPEMVEEVFRRIGALHRSAVRTLATMEGIGALRQGDDLGFKTSTFLSPDQLRQYVFPIYRDMAAEAHAHDKPFILHSCGNLAEVYEDLIEYCHIDAKHSFEDVIMPVGEFKRLYGERITPLGGLDVDMICRASEAELRAYARRMIEQCFADGHWALGTGNSLTNYMPVENYLIVLDEGMNAAGP